MRRFLVLTLMAALALSAASCSSDNKSNPVDPAAAEVSASAGDEALANSDLAGADAKYKEALAKDPGNGHANLGAAITNIALLQNDASVDSLLTFLDGVPLPAQGARAAKSTRMLARMGLKPGLKYDPMTNGRRLAKLMMRATSDPPLFSWAQTIIRNRIVTRLQYAQDRLAVIESHPTFTYLVPEAISGLDFPLEVDLGEVLMLDALVSSVEGVFGTLVVYNFDTPPGALNSDLLAPTSAFGTFHAGGAAMLATARLNLVRGSDRIAQMDAFVRAEGDPQDDDFIVAEVLDEPDFQDLEAAFDDMKTALTSTVSVDVEAYDGSPITIDVSVGNFFTTPITDWKTMLPTYAIDACDQVIITNPIAFPHPSFNGLFPDPIMTNTLWQNIIGPVDNPVCIVRPN